MIFVKYLPWVVGIMVIHPNVTLDVAKGYLDLGNSPIVPVLFSVITSKGLNIFPPINLQYVLMSAMIQTMMNKTMKQKQKQLERC